jgi:sarcosine oxidase, subunit beta
VRAADVIVVGGGIMGAATAFFLRRRGRSVILLERGLAGQQASGTNFGAVRRQGRPLHQLPLSHRSHALWMQLAQLVGETCEFTPSGHLAVAYTREKADAFEQYAREARECGLNLEIIRGDAISARFPYLGSGIAAGFLSPDDGHANPRLVAPALVRAAARAGAVIVENAEVYAVEKGGEDFRVCAAQGEFRAPVVVIAAGAWAGAMAAAHGEAVPLDCRGPQMAVTEPLPFRIKPMVGVLTDDAERFIYFRQVARGNLVFGGGIRGPASTDTNRAMVLPENTLRQLRYLRDLLPAATAGNVIRTWSGVEGYLPDSLPVIGPSARISGLFYAFGFCGQGFQLGLGVGDVLAELISVGRTDTPLHPCGIDRFQSSSQRAPDARQLS